MSFESLVHAWHAVEKMFFMWGWLPVCMFIAFTIFENLSLHSSEEAE
jgi:hypothetical protein